MALKKEMLIFILENDWSGHNSKKSKTWRTSGSKPQPYTKKLYRFVLLVINSPFHSYKSLLADMNHWILFSRLLLSLLIPTTEAQSDVFPFCDSPGNYTRGSQYETNLNTVLNSLASNISRIDFYNSSSGVEPNDVYGVLQCRGDVSREDCSAWGKTLATDVVKRCPFKKEAEIVNDNCWLYYADHQFFSASGDSERKLLSNEQNASEPILTNRRVQSLLSNLTSSAASARSRYAAGTLEEGTLGEVNGLLQCARDLSETRCSTCLEEHIKALSDCCSRKRGFRALSVNCFVRIELYRFFAVSPLLVVESPHSPENPVPDSRQPTDVRTPPAVESPHSPENPVPDSRQPTDSPLLPKTPRAKFAPTEPPLPTSASHPESPIAYSLAHSGVPKKLLTAAAVVGTITAVSIIFGCWYLLTKRNRRRKLMNLVNVEAFLKECGPFGPVRYKFSDVKKLTNSFKEKIGQGGFGEVFKGKLPDGKMVAVKVLSDVKGDGNEFINEVASISRTSHVNIVSLLGFSFEGHKRALIYEFMPNGSLEKFIYSEDPLKIRPHLGWQTLYEIAIGIAQGLEYLHRGCNSRIVHFDIKPHNILLDQDFHPKIADFGLSKLCHAKESTVLVTKARGTPGYIAPEVIYRNIGQVSHKSDVYSYGMMVLEMVGGRKNIDLQVSDSGIYYPHWIAKRLHQNEDLGLREIASLEDRENTRKMIIVSLWCIQIDPEIRPSMSRVLEMLEGSVEAFQLPPRPFSSSPLEDAASPSTKA